MQEEKLKERVVSLAGSGEVLKCTSLSICSSVFRFMAAHVNKYDRKACTAFGYSPFTNSREMYIHQGRRVLFRTVPRGPHRLVVPRRARKAGDLMISRAFLALSRRSEYAHLRNVSTLVAHRRNYYVYISATSYIPMLLCSERRRIMTTIRTK